MKKNLLLNIAIILLTIFSSQLFANSAFIEYYNKSSNWSSSEIAKGSLIITDAISLSQNIVLPNNIEVIIKNDGEFTSKGYKFSMDGDPASPGNEDPVIIYSRRFNLVPVNYLLLSDN